MSTTTPIALRSRYRSYRVDLKGQRDGKTVSVGTVEFHNHVATVDAQHEAQLRANPAYGVDFWIEDLAAIPSPPPPPAPPAPAPPAPAESEIESDDDDAKKKPGKKKP